MQIHLRAATIALIGFTGAACELGETFEADRYLNASIPVGTAGQVVLDVPVPVRVTGARGQAELTVTGTLTVSTSSAPRSRELAAALKVEHELEGGVLTAGVRVPGSGGGTPFPEATVRGTLEVRLPSDLPLEIIQRGGAAVVAGMSAELDIRSVGPVQVVDAPASVSVRCDNGPVDIETRAAPGTRTFLGMVSGGEARVRLPAALNARVVAQTGDGLIYLRHPQLRPGPAEPYDVVAGTALADVEVSVGRGNILLLTR